MNSTQKANGRFKKKNGESINIYCFLMTVFIVNIKRILYTMIPHLARVSFIIVNNIIAIRGVNSGHRINFGSDVSARFKIESCIYFGFT